jgi:WD40 repeat protein
MDTRTPRGPKPVCKYFTVNSCRQGSNCKFSHSISRVSTLSKAAECLNAFLVLDGLTYTACSGLRGWRPEWIKPDIQLKFHEEFLVESKEKITAVTFYNGNLLAGLANGVIRIYNKSTGAVIDVPAHNKEIYVFSAMGDILISCGWDGVVIFWDQQMQILKKFETGNPVKSGNLLGSNFWAAGVLGVSVVGMNGIIGSLPLKSPVMGLSIVSNTHAVVACLDGSLHVYDSNGLLTFETTLNSICNDSKTVTCSEITGNGKYLCLGQKNGIVKIIELPSFKCLASVEAFERHDVRCIKDVGINNLFLIGASNGSFSLWKIHP